ncbi:MAG: manganese ABC transporter ATP-binding protein [Acidimicrobiales bacterium]|nr:MAG: manganese ABC transporter ATP-binding protein [Acidimicrobiales bacterium]
MSAALAIRDLEVRYGDAVALTDVDLDLPAGRSLAVIGPNGSGKSTLLNAIAGLVTPAAGTIRYDGAAPALVLQATEVDRSLPITVADTIGLARYPSLGLLRRFGAADRDALADSMRRLAIEDLAPRQLHDLSGGQRQRVLVAQGIAQRSDLLLLDEPVTGLDVTSRGLILDVIRDELAEGRSVVVTTHDLDDARICDQVLLVDKHAIAVGSPDEVLTEDNLVHAFGGRFIRVGDRLILDDPHHHHQH